MPNDSLPNNPDPELESTDPTLFSADEYLEEQDPLYLNDWIEFGEDNPEVAEVAAGNAIRQVKGLNVMRRAAKEAAHEFNMNLPQPLSKRLDITREFYRTIRQDSALEGAEEDLEIAGYYLKDGMEAEQPTAEHYLEVVSIFTDLARMETSEDAQRYRNEALGLAREALLDKTISWADQDKISVAMLATDLVFDEIREKAAAGGETYLDIVRLMHVSVGALAGAMVEVRKLDEDSIARSEAMGSLLEWATQVEFMQRAIEAGTSQELRIRHATIRQDKGYDELSKNGNGHKKANFDMIVDEKDEEGRWNRQALLQLKKSDYVKGNEYRHPIQKKVLKSANLEAIVDGAVALRHLYEESLAEGEFAQVYSEKDKSRLADFHHAFEEVYA